MTIKGNQCPICGEEVILEQGRINGSNLMGTKFVCKKCGKIILAESVEKKYLLENDDWKFRACLYYYFANMKTENDKPYYIYLKERVLPNDLQMDEFNILTYEEIMRLFPQNYSETIDKILLNLYSLDNRIGSNIEIEDNNQYIQYVFFVSDNEQVYGMIHHLVQMNYIESESTGDDTLEITLSPLAWQRIDELQKNNRVFKKAFIAMSFDPSLQDIRDAIKSAIGENGYLPDIIDEKEHNNEIMPEIYYAIETSDFVVADLTHNRGGVYLEAGYALGLGKQVIFTVNETLQEKDGKVNAETPHFDVQQRNQIRYKDAEELKEKLIKRIEATMGLANVKK